MIFLILSNLLILLMLNRSLIERIDMALMECSFMKNIELKRLPMDFTVCKVRQITELDLASDFVFIGKTDEELSLVCLTERVPESAEKREDGWKGFRIQGILDFSLTGILAPIADLLAENQIGIFAISTFQTDYVLVKRENFERALALLSEAGYTIV